MIVLVLKQKLHQYGIEGNTKNILKEITEPVGVPFRTMPQEPWHAVKGAKPGCIN